MYVTISGCSSAICFICSWFSILDHNARVGQSCVMGGGVMKTNCSKTG